MGDAPRDSEPPRVRPRRRVVRHARLTRSFLILHGLQGSGPEHWQSWLAPRLRERGENVRYPDLPDPFDPEPGEWLDVLHVELAALEGERVILCHSLACLLWLLHARDGGDSADRVLLVAPPCTDEVPAIVRFRPDGVTGDHVRRMAPETLIACAPADDPYCARGAQAVFADLGVDFELFPGGGHLNTDAGYGPWPWVERWALRTPT